MFAKVITRFPPSPTGALHLGGARTALFNWLFARHYGGEFVFRLEDTDRQRSRDEYVTSIIDALQWLGMDYDQGPFYQSRRLERYRLVIDQLLRTGRAYWCHCTPEQLEEQRAQARAEGRKPMYAGRCRQSGLGPAPGAVVRLQCPQAGITEFDDLIKGRISVANSELDDLIIMRSDGSPTYHLAVVVDDIDMSITHVIRGDDHVSNTSRQIHIYNALNAPLPHFAHVPMILGPDKAKLSKRHGAEAVMEYQEQGFLPEAMINMLARLGWSHGDQEIFDLRELIDLFDLKAVGKSPSVFDQDKLLNLNHHYLQRCAPPRLESLLTPFLSKLGVNEPHQPTLRACLPHILPRGRTLAELAHWAQPYLLDMPLLDPAARAKFLTPASKPLLQRLLYLLETCALADDLEAAIMALSQELDMKLGALLPLLRVALTGRSASPGIFEVIAILGRERSIARVKAALAEIN
jgi:glutamyl-tRNA synthetase